jgi:hypothetical protein
LNWIINIYYYFHINKLHKRHVWLWVFECCRLVHFCVLCLLEANQSLRSHTCREMPCARAYKSTDEQDLAQLANEQLKYFPTRNHMLRQFRVQPLSSKLRLFHEYCTEKAQSSGAVHLVALKIVGVEFWTFFSCCASNSNHWPHPSQISTLIIMFSLFYSVQLYFPRICFPFTIIFRPLLFCSFEHFDDKSSPWFTVQWNTFNTTHPNFCLASFHPFFWLTFFPTIFFFLH